MPLITICGYPCSGKTYRALELQEYFKKENYNVVLISENAVVEAANFDKNECFSSAEQEKLVRSKLKSSVIASLNKTDVVILDAGNYIKGKLKVHISVWHSAHINMSLAFQINVLHVRHSYIIVYHSSLVILMLHQHISALSIKLVVFTVTIHNSLILAN